MHELSVASSIVELVEQEARKAQAKRVTKVILDIGSLAGIENEALMFAWEVAIDNTVVKGALLEIRDRKAKAVCTDCNQTFEVETFFTPCPSCKGFHHDIIQGRELQINSILIED